MEIYFWNWHYGSENYISNKLLRAKSNTFIFLLCFLVHEVTNILKKYSMYNIFTKCISVWNKWWLLVLVLLNNPHAFLKTAIKKPDAFFFKSSKVTLKHQSFFQKFPSYVFVFDRAGN